VRLNAQVVKILSDSPSTASHPTYKLEVQTGDKKQQFDYDAVFIAAPAEYLDLETPLPGTWKPNREYVHKSVTYVRSSGLNTAFLGFDSDAILTNANSSKQGTLRFPR
jgi:hypothetical protein